MPGLTSMDSLIAAIAAGQFYRDDWNKNYLPTTLATAGTWSSFMRAAGNPPAPTIYGAGTNLALQTTFDSTSGGSGMPHGGSVAPAYKSLLNASAYSAAATSVPGVLMLIDVVGFYNVTTVTTTGNQALSSPFTAFSTFTTNYTSNNILTFNQTPNTGLNLKNLSTVQVSSSGTLPTGLSASTNYYVITLSDTTIELASSYANAQSATPITLSSNGSGTLTLNTIYPRYTDGAGLQAFIYVNTATAMGAATPNINIQYTNTIGSTGQTTPTVLPVGTSAAYDGNIVYSGTGVGKYGPFLPLVAGDKGIASATGFNLASTYTSGQLALVICKPLLTLPMTTIGVAGERDLLNQVPSLPRIYDGANLQWLLYNGVATPINTSYFGHFDVVWN